MIKQEWFAAVSILLFPYLSHAGAWTQEKHAWQLITTTSAYKASHYFDAYGKKHSQTPFYKQALSQYAEYGWRDDITLGGQLGLARAAQNSATVANSSGWNIEDTSLFLRKTIWNHPHQIVSVQPFVVLPSPRQKTGAPKTGSDHTTFGAQIAYGTSLQALGYSHYASITTGYAHRFGSPHDQINLEATLGITLSPRWQVMPQAFVTHTPSKRNTASFTQSSNDDYDVSKLQLSALYQLHKHGHIQLGTFTTLTGRNTGDGMGALLGYWRSF